MQHVVQPVQILRRQGLIQSQLSTHGRPIFLRGEFNADAEQRVIHRVARRNTPQQEGCQRNAQQNRDQYQQSASDIG